MYKALLTILLLAPALTLAAVEAPKTFKDVVGIILDINASLIVLIFGLTFLVLAWTVVKTWIIQGGDKDAVESGKKVITVGVIVLVIMTGIWGILEIIQSSFFGLV